MVYEINPSIPTQESLRTDPILAEAADVSYATSKSGPYTITACSFAYLPHSHFVPSNDLAAITSSLNIDPASLRDRILIRRLFSADPLGQTEYVLHLGNNSPYFASRPGKKYATIWQMLQYPFSKGSIHIPAMENGKTVTSDDKPVIDPQYFAGPGGQVDFLMMVAGQKFADKICSTKPLSDIILSRVFPIPDLNMAPKDEDFAAWVRDTTITDWHPVGTCAMGGREAKDGYVTDARLRVYGVKGLRVVDASIMPLQIGAHLQATIYAIGEKGAQMILEDWESRVTVK